MASYPYNDFINKPVKLFNKFPLKDSILVVVGVLVFYLLSDMITIIIPIPKIVITVIGLILLIGYIVLMVKASKKKHPTYLASLFARIFMQPKVLKVSCNNYQFDFLERRKKTEQKISASILNPSKQMFGKGKSNKLFK